MPRPKSAHIYGNTSESDNGRGTHHTVAHMVDDSSSGFFAGSVNADARNGIFNDYSSNLNFVYGNHSSNFANILATLRPVDRGACHVPRCMDGTREHIFEEIDQWLDSANAPNVLWLSGSPGAGKSTIASSMVLRLAERGRLGSDFFFRRGDVMLSDPTALWRTVAYDLAKFKTFRKFVVKALRNRKVDPGRPEIDMHFKFLIEEPLRKSYKPSKPQATPVIIIDALDECDSNRSQPAQRKTLLDTLVQWSRLPKMFKLLVTGRDERVPESFRASCKHIILLTGEEVDADTNNDIRHFFETRFVELDGSLFPEWPGEHILNKLTARAAGLFIWAEIVMRFLEQGLPDEQLELVLGGDLGDEDNLTKLYRQLISSLFRDVKGRALEMYKLVVSAIVLGKVPFHQDHLHAFISEKNTSVKFILDRLSSVISIGTLDSSLRICHVSFSEFLCDARRCPKEFFINRRQESQRLAMTCFQQMKDGLKFNICGLDTSYLRNDDVEGLSKHIETKITGPLLYSCRFWAAHCRDTTDAQDGRDTLLQQVRDFLHHRFLYWLEVMSLTKGVLTANIALLTAAPWIDEFDKDLSAFARDASRFIINFAVPISESVPHIYLSALPFSPAQSLVAQKYQGSYPNTVSVVSGRDTNWPALVNILEGHTGLISSVSCSTDGKRIVSGSWDGTVRVWDSETGELSATLFKDHKDAVHSIILSRDGKQVISSCWNTMTHAWDIETGQLIALTGPFTNYGTLPYCLASSSHSTQIASCGDGKTTQMQDLEASHLSIGTSNIYPKIVYSLASSPDSTQIVLCTDGKTIHVRDRGTGHLTAGPFEGHTNLVCSLAFSPDGRQVASGSKDTTVRVWDVGTNQLIAGPFKGHKKLVSCVAFLPDSKRVVSGSWDCTICMWDVKTGQLITGPLKGHKDWITSVASSSDGKRVISGSEDRTIRVWDVETGLLTAGPFEGHTEPVTSLAFSLDREWIVSGSIDKTLRVWDVNTGRLGTHPFEGYSNSPDGKRVISESRDTTSRLWNGKIDNPTSGPIEGHSQSVTSVSFLPDSKGVVSGSHDKAICIWDVGIGQLTANSFENSKVSIACLAFSSEGKQVVSGSWDMAVHVWDVETGRLAAGPLEGHTDPVYSVAFSQDGRRVVSGSGDRTIRVWDVDTGQLAAGPFYGHTLPIYSVAFSPDRRQVVSGSDDKTVRVWDVESGQLTAGPFEGHSLSITSVAFSPDGRYVISGSWDTTLRLWDVWTGQLTAGPLEGHTESVASVAFSPDGKRVVSGSGDGTIRIWDIDKCLLVAGSFEGGKIEELITGPLHGHTSAICSVAFSPDGKLVVSGSADRTIRVWDMKIGKCLSPQVLSKIANHFGEYASGWLIGLDLVDTRSRYGNLLWIPPSCRSGLCGIETLAVFGARTVRLDFSRFVNGKSWIKCYSPPADASARPSTSMQVVPSSMQ